MKHTHATPLRPIAMLRVSALAMAVALAAAAHAPALAQVDTSTKAIARTARGAVGSIEVVYRDAPLRAKALRDANSPVLVRVTSLGGDRYRIDYIASVTGTFDLAPAIERADGRAPEGLGGGLGSLTVEIFSQLPPNAGTDVFGLTPPGFRLSAHYTTALWTIALAWAAVPTVILVRRAMRRKPPAAPAPAPREPTVADLLFEAVDAARARELSADERGALELRLLQILRRGAPDGDAATAIAALRADPRTAEIVRAVESWLHAPEGGDAARALAEIDALRANGRGGAA